jgi:uncharacterized membrane protein
MHIIYYLHEKYNSQIEMGCFIFTGVGEKVQFRVVSWASSATYDFTTTYSCTYWPGTPQTADVVAVSCRGALAATLPFYLDLF